MKKISVQKIIEFNRLNTNAKKKRFLNSLQKPSEKGEGGNYWISASSALGNALKENDNTIITKKIDEIIKKKKVHNLFISTMPILTF